MSATITTTTELVALTDGERRAFRMGVLAAGGVFISACEAPCGCRERVENLRISIAGRAIECEPPEFWPTGGGSKVTHGSPVTTLPRGGKR